MANSFNFTKAALNALPLPETGARSTYLDTKAAGLQLRVTGNGSKTFSFYRRIKAGQPGRVTLGRFPDMAIEQARRRAAELNSAIANGGNPAQVKRAHKLERTFADLYGEYLERHSKPSKRTWRGDVDSYRLYLKTPMGDKKLSAIDRAMLSRIHGAISRVGHPATANRTLALVSSIFGWGISAGLCETNPARGVRRNPEKSRDRFLQSDELPRFFAALADEPNTILRDYFLVSLLTGARRGNVLTMRWQDINFERAEWRIPRTKNDDPQTVTLSPEAVEVLHGRKRDSEFVFPGAGACGHLVEPRKGWLRILARAGISGLRIHDLRRTLGSWQAKTGASLVIIGKSLNHRNIQTTAIYARLDTDPVRESLSRATAAMLTAAGLKPGGEVIKLKQSS